MKLVGNTTGLRGLHGQIEAIELILRVYIARHVSCHEIDLQFTYFDNHNNRFIGRAIRCAWVGRLLPKQESARGRKVQQRTIFTSIVLFKQVLRNSVQAQHTQCTLKCQQIQDKSSRADRSNIADGPEMNDRFLGHPSFHNIGHLLSPHAKIGKGIGLDKPPILGGNISHMVGIVEWAKKEPLPIPPEKVSRWVRSLCDGKAPYRKLYTKGSKWNTLPTYVVGVYIPQPVLGNGGEQQSAH